MKRHLTMDFPHHGIAKHGNHKTGGRNNHYPVSPKESVIRNILNYSLALNVMETRGIGIVSLMMN